MYLLTNHGHPISKPHPHRITCYIEAIERELVVRSGWRYWLADGIKIERLSDEHIPN